MSDPGYAFVPLPPSGAVRRVERRQARHDRVVADTIAARLTFRLVAEQAVHVGSGFKVLRNGHVVRGGVTFAGAPCVPGATLKGVLRSRYEAISRSCAVFGANERPVEIRSSQERYRGFQAKFARDVAHHEVFRACTKDAWCPACCLFGRMSLRGRVWVSDFVAEANTEFEIARVASAFSPNLHHAGPTRECRGQQLLEVTALHGRKFACGQGPEGDAGAAEPIEVVASGSALCGEIRVSNLTESEFGGLLIALGAEPESRLKVGGGKGHGFGRMRIEDLRIALRSTSLPLRSEYAEYAQLFRGSEDAWPVGIDRLVRIHAEENNP